MSANGLRIGTNGVCFGTELLGSLIEPFLILPGERNTRPFSLKQFGCFQADTSCAAESALFCHQVLPCSFSFLFWVEAIANCNAKHTKYPGTSGQECFSDIANL